MPSTRGGGLARGILVGDGPTRRLGGESEAALLLHGIDLDDHAIDFVRQVFALGFPVGAEGEHVVDGVAGPRFVVHLEAHLLEGA